MKEKLLEKVSKYAYIDIFENPDFLNKLRLADQLIPKFNSFFNSLAMLFSGVLGSLPFLWIGITTAWWVPLALIAGFLPSLIIKWNLEERLWALEIQNGEAYKEAAVHEHILLDSAFAKEIRLWNAASFILKRWKKNRYNLLRETSRLRNKSMGMTLLAHIFEGLVDCTVIAYLYMLVSRNALTTGAFVFAVTAVIQLRQNAFTVLLFGVDLKSDFNRLKPYFDVINYDEKEAEFMEYQTPDQIVYKSWEYNREHSLDTVILNEFNRTNDTDIEQVKISYGPAADEYARQNHALALVVANTIYFRNGAYKPETEEGRKLLAHELTHIAQNKDTEAYRNSTVEEKEAEAEAKERGEISLLDKNASISIGEPILLGIVFIFFLIYGAIYDIIKAKTYRK